jgi:hypothetical protein
MEDKDQQTEDRVGRVFSGRRLLSAVTAAAVYTAVVFVTGDTGSASSGTAHTIRYLTILSGVYTLLSGTNSAVGYLRSRSLHPDTASFFGGLSTTVGLGVFYAGALATGVENNVYALAVSCVTISVGMVLTTKV